MLGVNPRPSESAVSFARGGFGGLTVSGEGGFLETGDDGDFARSASAVHALHQCSFVLNVTLSPGSNFRLYQSNTQLLAIPQHIATHKHTHKHWDELIPSQHSAAYLCVCHAPTIRLSHDDILARHQKHLIIIIIIQRGERHDQVTSTENG